MKAKDKDEIMVRHKLKRQADVILLIAIHVIFVKLYISTSIGYMFSISMLWRQLFICRFWSDDDYDDDCTDGDSDDGDYDEHDYFVYILIFIMFITYNMFSGMELWEVWYYLSLWEQLQLPQADL